MLKEEERKGTKRPRPPGETPMMTRDQHDYFRCGYVYASTSVQSTSQDGTMTEPSQPSQPTASISGQMGIPPLVHLQHSKEPEVSSPLHLQPLKQREVPLGALQPVSLHQPKQPEVPPPAHLQQAKLLRMQAPTRVTWTVPRPPKCNVNYYINYYTKKKET